MKKLVMKKNKEEITFESNLVVKVNTSDFFNAIKKIKKFLSIDKNQEKDLRVNTIRVSFEENKMRFVAFDSFIIGDIKIPFSSETPIEDFKDELFYLPKEVKKLGYESEELKITFTDRSIRVKSETSDIVYKNTFTEVLTIERLFEPIVEPDFKVALTVKHLKRVIEGLENQGGDIITFNFLAGHPHSPIQVENIYTKNRAVIMPCKLGKNYE